MQIKCPRYFLIGLLSIIFSSFVHAQGYPNRPITVIVPFSAGSASDVVTRVLLEKVATNNNIRFVFDNRPAAGGNVGTAAVVKADPDGYTIGMSST